MSRRQALWVTALFLLTLLLGLVVNMPVMQLLHVVKLPQNLALQGVSGTLVDARVERVRYQGIELRGLSVSLRPACLLKLSLCYRLVSAESGVTIELAGRALSRDLVITDSRVLLPDSLFAALPQLLAQPSGEFNLNIRHLRIADNRVSELQALLNWANAGLKGEEQVLGNYSANVSLEAEGLVIELTDQDSLLGLQGNARIGLDGAYQVDIRLVGKPQLNPSVYSVVEMLGQKTAANSYLVRRQGRLPPAGVHWLNLALAAPNPAG